MIEEKREDITVGDILSSVKEEEYYVLDENEYKVPCRSLAEAKILSLLLELKYLK